MGVAWLEIGPNSKAAERVKTERKTRIRGPCLTNRLDAVPQTGFACELPRGRKDRLRNFVSLHSGRCCAREKRARKRCHREGIRGSSACYNFRASPSDFSVEGCS